MVQSNSIGIEDRLKEASFVSALTVQMKNTMRQLYGEQATFFTYGFENVANCATKVFGQTDDARRYAEYILRIVIHSGAISPSYDASTAVHEAHRATLKAAGAMEVHWGEYYDMRPCLGGSLGRIDPRNPDERLSAYRASLLGLMAPSSETSNTTAPELLAAAGG